MSFAFLPLYTGDYRRDTQHLTPLRHGIYLLLLFHCWDTQGPAPLDEQETGGIANCRSADEIEALRYVLSRFFVRMEDGYYNKRMQREIERAHEISTKREDAGRRGANERMRRFREAQASAKQVLSKSLASDATPTTTTTTTTTTTPTPTPTTTATSKTKSKALAPPSAIKPPKVVPSGEVWSAYSTAYFSRYGTEPVRNAVVNGQLKNFVARVGAPEAPAIASHYLRSDNARYVKGGHSCGLMLHDAEKLRMEWATGTGSGVSGVFDQLRAKAREQER